FGHHPVKLLKKSRGFLRCLEGTLQMKRREISPLDVIDNCMKMPPALLLYDFLCHFIQTDPFVDSEQLCQRLRGRRKQKGRPPGGLVDARVLAGHRSDSRQCS